MGAKKGPQNSFNRCNLATLTAQSTGRSDCNQTSHHKFGLINIFHKLCLLAWYFMCLSCSEEEMRRESVFCFFRGKEGIQMEQSVKPREGPLIVPRPSSPECQAQLWLLQSRVGQRGGASDNMLSLRASELPNLHVFQYLVKKKMVASSRGLWKKKMKTIKPIDLGLCPCTGF